MRVPLFNGALVDPPWPEKGGTPVAKDGWGGGKRGADSKYHTVPVHEMPTIIERSGVWNMAPDSHLYMWATDTHLRQALWLMAVLGYSYRRQLVWPKREDSDGSFGIGRYFRTKHEVLLFGVRGKGMAVCTKAKGIHTLIPDDPPGVRVHSRKPLAVYDKVEARTIGPYVEIFGRKLQAARPGWWHYGNEVDANNPNVSLLRCA